VLITADVSEELKQRKESLGSTWTFIILRGIQSLEGKQDTVIKDLQTDNAKIQEKLRSLAMKIYNLEVKND